MKLKSYNILFRIFSFFSDRTNGAPFFVKYKLLLGTLIISMVGTSAKAQKKEVASDTITPQRPVPAETTCYKVAVPQDTDSIQVKGYVTDEGGEPLIGVFLRIKDKANGIVTNPDGRFVLKATANDVLIFSYIGFKPKEIPVSKIKNGEVTVVLEEDDMVLCYEVVVVGEPKSHWDDIYASPSKPKELTKLSYTEVQRAPISPVGNLEAFQDWVQSNINYTEQLQKGGVKGEVILSFAIDKKGKLVDKKVIGKLSKEADKEALRALSLSDKWTPGEQYGNPVKTTMVITLKFGDE